MVEPEVAFNDLLRQHGFSRTFVEYIVQTTIREREED